MIARIISEFKRRRFLFVRWIAKKRLLSLKKLAVKQAEEGYKINGKRHYVILLVDRYEVVSSIDVKHINRLVPKGERWDFMKIMQNCVYHTK
ncbi:hypothetical protein EG830_08265 [bacterium]|nr:hypothetical protein [bacterium]